MEIDAAVAAATVERVKRPERSAALQQPPVVESDKRRENSRWRTFALVERPAGGKNTARKQQQLGPFHAPTKEAAEALRAAAIDAFLYDPVKPKKATTAGSSSSTQPPLPPTESDAKRPKRDAAPSAPGALKLPNILPGGSSRRDGSGAGSGCCRPAPR